MTAICHAPTHIKDGRLCLTPTPSDAELTGSSGVEGVRSQNRHSLSLVPTPCSNGDADIPLRPSMPPRGRSIGAVSETYLISNAAMSCSVDDTASLASTMDGSISSSQSPSSRDADLHRKAKNRLSANFWRSRGHEVKSPRSSPAPDKTIPRPVWSEDEDNKEFTRSAGPRFSALSRRRPPSLAMLAMPSNSPGEMLRPARQTHNVPDESGDEPLEVMSLEGQQAAAIPPRRSSVGACRSSHHHKERASLDDNCYSLALDGSKARRYSLVQRGGAVMPDRLASTHRRQQECVIAPTYTHMHQAGHNDLGRLAEEAGANLNLKRGIDEAEAVTALQLFSGSSSSSSYTAAAFLADSTRSDCGSQDSTSSNSFGEPRRPTTSRGPTTTPLLDEELVEHQKQQQQQQQLLVVPDSESSGARQAAAASVALHRLSTSYREDWSSGSRRRKRDDELPEIAAACAFGYPEIRKHPPTQQQHEHPHEQEKHEQHRVYCVAASEDLHCAGIGSSKQNKDKEHNEDLRGHAHALKKGNHSDPRTAAGAPSGQQHLNLTNANGVDGAETCQQHSDWQAEPAAPAASGPSAFLSSPPPLPIRRPVTASPRLLSRHGIGGQSNSATRPSTRPSPSPVQPLQLHSAVCLLHPAQASPRPWSALSAPAPAYHRGSPTALDSTLSIDRFEDRPAPPQHPAPAPIRVPTLEEQRVFLKPIRSARLPPQHHDQRSASVAKLHLDVASIDSHTAIAVQGGGGSPDSFSSSDSPPPPSASHTHQDTTAAAGHSTSSPMSYEHHRRRRADSLTDRMPRSSASASASASSSSFEPHDYQRLPVHGQGSKRQTATSSSSSSRNPSTAARRARPNALPDHSNRSEPWGMMVVHAVPASDEPRTPRGRGHPSSSSRRPTSSKGAVRRPTTSPGASAGTFGSQVKLSPVPVPVPGDASFLPTPTIRVQQHKHGLKARLKSLLDPRKKQPAVEFDEVII